MRMSSKSRFAVQAMIDLAMHARSAPLALALISERQGVSLSYMEQLFAKLRRHGLVESTRGPGGGYTLARRATEISVGDIAEAAESDAEPASDANPTTKLWAELDDVMLRHMRTITLQSLVQGRSEEPLPVRTRSAAAPPAAEPAYKRAPNSVFAFGQSFLG